MIQIANLCSNSIAFYQQDGGNALVEAFYADVQKYMDFTDPETGKPSDWVGHWFDSNRINTDNLYTRGFFTACEFYDTHVIVHMETAWSPLPEVWDLMAEKYNLSYVYIAEECGMSIYVNTDSEGRFFSTRYIFDYFDVDCLELDSETANKYGKRLRGISGETSYYDDFDDVMETFEEFKFNAKNIDELNKCLERFNISVHEYSSE